MTIETILLALLLVCWLVGIITCCTLMTNTRTSKPNKNKPQQYTYTIIKPSKKFIIPKKK